MMKSILNLESGLLGRGLAQRLGLVLPLYPSCIGREGLVSLSGWD